MKVSIYLGPRHTDLDRIYQCLAKNRDMLLDQKILLADPIKTHSIIGETLRDIKGGPVSDEMRADLMGKLLDGADAETLVICDHAALGPNFDADGMYPMAGLVTGALGELFAGHDVTISLSLRNPATLLAAQFSGTDDPFDQFLNGVDPKTLLWSDIVSKINATPDTNLQIWRSEDSPLIWLTLLMALSGSNEKLVLDGMYDFPESLMTAQGVGEFHRRLERRNPPLNSRRQRVVSNMLAQFVREDVIEQEIDLPGWDTAYVNALTQRYDDDFEMIQTLDGIEIIAP